MNLERLKSYQGHQAWAETECLLESHGTRWQGHDGVYCKLVGEASVGKTNV